MKKLILLPIILSLLPLSFALGPVARAANEIPTTGSSVFPGAPQMCIPQGYEECPGSTVPVWNPRVVIGPTGNLLSAHIEWTIEKPINQSTQACKKNLVGYDITDKITCPTIPTGNTTVNPQLSMTQQAQTRTQAQQQIQTQTNPNVQLARPRLFAALALPTCPPGQSVDSAIGNIPICDPNKFAAWFLRWALGIGGGIAFLLILKSGFEIMTSSGNPDRLKGGKEQLTSAVTGLLLLIFSVFLLKLIGVDILHLPGF